MGFFMVAEQEAHPEGLSLVHVGVTFPLGDRVSPSSCNSAANKQKGASRYWHWNNNYKYIKAFETQQTWGRQEKQLLLSSFDR